MKLNILLLCNKPNVGNDANTIVDHIESIENHSKHQIWLCSNLGNIPRQLDLNRFDVIIIHYSICLLNDFYLSKKSKNRITAFKGLKVVFVQDEYRQINKMNSELRDLDIDVLFTCFPESEIDKIYTKKMLPNVSKYTNLTGYIPERLLHIKKQAPVSERPIDVGYRSRKLLFWYGQLAFEKSDIVDKWFQHVGSEQLKVDLSYNEKDRIYGENWISFLSSCKTTLGVESGTSVMDFTGDIEKIVEQYQLKHPEATFTEVQNKFLKDHEGKYKLNQISPRCFEAIVLKTVLVLYEGEYSGVLVPGRHFIVLKKDYSNIQEVLGYIKDDMFLQAMADRAYTEVALNPEYNYQAFIEKVDNILINEFQSRSKTLIKNGYRLEQYQKIMNWLKMKNQCNQYARQLHRRMPFWLRVLLRGFMKPHVIFKPSYLWTTLQKHRRGLL